MSDERRPDEPEDHTTVEELIDALRADGEVDSRGAFSLDRDLARTKMRRFQLQNPAHYVLSLVHAAVLKNATRVDFHMDDDDMQVSFDGRAFTLADLEHLYGALFSVDRGPDVEALRELAIAINAASALETRTFRLRSGDSTQAVRYELREDGEEEFGREDEAVMGTHIQVKTRFKGRFARAFAFLAEEHPLLRALRVCCQFSWMPITVNGKRISRGLELSRAVGTVPFETPNLRGVAGFLPDADQPGVVHLCKYGVWFSTVVQPNSRPGYFAVVEGYRLRKDISQTRAVNDAALAEVIHAVHKATDPAVDQLCREALEPPPGRTFPAGWARQVLKGELLGRSPDALFGPKIDERIRNLTRLPLWLTFASADKGGRHRQSLDDLRSYGEAGGSVSLVAYSHLDEEGGVRWVEPLVGESRILIIAVRDRADRDFLRRVLGPH